MMIKNIYFLPQILGLTDEKRNAHAHDIIRSLPPRGGLIFRHYQSPRRNQEAKRAANLARRHQRSFAVAGDLNLALACGAQGLHLPEYILKRHPDWIERFKDAGGIWTTTSVHSRQALNHALKTPVDGMIISPIFPTPSHPQQKALGIIERNHLFLQTFSCSRAPFAMGGISQPKHLKALKHLPIYGLAGISLFKD